MEQEIPFAHFSGHALLKYLCRMPRLLEFATLVDQGPLLSLLSLTGLTDIARSLCPYLSSS